MPVENVENLLKANNSNKVTVNNSVYNPEDELKFFKIKKEHGINETNFKNYILSAFRKKSKWDVKDVASLIGHSQVVRMIQNIDDEEKGIYNVYTLGGNQEAWFLTEDGLYEVLMQSRRPIAKAFKKEVKNILKQIRKNGAYMTPSTIEKVLSDPDFIIKLATNLKEEQEKRKLVEKKIIELKPKAEFYDAISIGEVAKVLG